MLPVRMFFPSLVVSVLAYCFCVRALLSVLLKNHEPWLKERGMQTTMKWGILSTDPKLLRFIYSRDMLGDRTVAKLKRIIWLLTAALFIFADCLFYLKLQGRI